MTNLSKNKLHPVGDSSTIENDDETSVLPTETLQKPKLSFTTKFKPSPTVTDLKLRRIAASISEKRDQDEKYHFESIRVKAKEFLAHSIIGEFYNSIMLLISLFSSFHFIYNTYRDDGDEKDFMELGIAIIFTLDWCLSCFLADHKVLFFTRYVDCYHFHDHCLHYSPSVSIPWLT